MTTAQARIYYENTSYVTQVNPACSDEKITAYFMQNESLINVGQGGNDKLVKVLKVEVIRD